MIRPFLTLKEMFDEFLSTFEEWHYFAAGLAIGGLVLFVLGWVLSQVIGNG